MQSALDYLAWYLTALLCGLVLLPAIYGFATADWLALGPALGLVYLTCKTISILRQDKDPASLLAHWVLIAMLSLIVRSI